MRKSVAVALPLSTRFSKKGRRKKSIEFFILKSFEKTRKPQVLNEIRLLQTIHHKHVVAYQNWYETKNHFWIIYEYLSGGDLSLLITQDKGIPEAMLRVIARMLIEGLQYLHSKGTLFYNFKPGNFVFDEYNNLKYADFAYARLMTDKEEPSGCPAAYLSPELLSKTREPSVESDLWSLGVLLHEIATGTLPFPGQTEEEVLESIKKTTLGPISGYSSDFLHFLNGILAKSVKDRYGWEEILGHRWNLLGAPVGLSNAQFSSNRGRSVDQVKSPTGRQRTVDKTPPQIQNDSVLVHSQLNQPSQAQEDRRQPKSQTLKDISSEESRIEKTSNYFQYNTNNTETTAASKTNKTQTNSTGIGIKKDTTVSALSRQELTKRPQNPLPVKSTKPDLDSMKRQKMLKADSLKDNSSTGSFQQNVISTMSKTDSSSRRKLTPATLKNEQSGSNRVIAARRMHSKNYSAVALPHSLIQDDSQLSNDPKSEAFGADSLPPSCFNIEKRSIETSEDRIDERRKTPEMTKYAKKVKTGSFVKRKPVFNPLGNLRSQWRNVVRDIETQLSEKSKSDLSGRDISPIVANENIQILELNSPVPGLIPPELNEDLETPEKAKAYLALVIKLINSALTETHKSSVVYHVCRQLDGGTLANDIATSSLLETFLKTTKTAATKSLKIATTTLIGLVFRFATILNSDRWERVAISVLTEQLKDSNETVKQRSLAALGEFLFYQTTQTENSKTPSSLLVGFLPTLLSVLKTFSDPVSLAYAVKTIENITTKASQNGRVLATEEFASALVTVADQAKDAYLKSVAFRCLDNMLMINPQIAKLLIKKQIPESCMLTLLDKHPEVSAASISLLANIIPSLDIKMAETTEKFWQKHLKNIVDLISSDFFALKNESLRFVLVIMLRDLFSIPGLFYDSAINPTIDRCMREIPPDGSDNFDITSFNNNLEFFGRICSRLIDFLLKNTQALFKQLVSVKTSQTKSRSRTPLSKGKEEPETGPSANELAESVDALLKLQVQILSADFMLETLSENHVVAIYRLAGDIGQLNQYCSEDTVSALFALISLVFKDEEKTKEFIPALTGPVYAELVASFGKETDPEAQSAKFELITGLILSTMIDLGTTIVPGTVLKAVHFVIGNINSHNSKVNLRALQTLRSLFDAGLVLKTEVNLKKVVRETFQAVLEALQETLNQNFFSIMTRIMELSDDTYLEVYNNGFIEISVDYLSRFDSSVNLSEVFECLACFFKIVYKRAKSSNFEERITLVGSELEDVLKSALKSLKDGQRNVCVPALLLVYYVVVLNAGVVRSTGLIVERPFRMAEHDFGILHKLKDFGDAKLSKKIVKLGKIVKG